MIHCDNKSSGEMFNNRTPKKMLCGIIIGIMHSGEASMKYNYRNQHIEHLRSIRWCNNSKEYKYTDIMRSILIRDAVTGNESIKKTMRIKKKPISVECLPLGNGKVQRSRQWDSNVSGVTNFPLKVF